MTIKLHALGACMCVAGLGGTRWGGGPHVPTILHIGLSDESVAPEWLSKPHQRPIQSSGSKRSGHPPALLNRTRCPRLTRTWWTQASMHQKRTQPTICTEMWTQQWLGLLNPDLDQRWHRWHSSKAAEKNISHLMRFVPFGCVSCKLNFHSAGTRCCLCLAGENGHHSKRDWKQVKQRCNTNTTVPRHANRTDSLFRLKPWMILS